MITEDYVSYEVAKLLKEKGFLKTVDLRMTQNLSFYDTIGLSHNLNKYYDRLIQEKIDFVVAPTLQMAMKWLREVHKLYIEICTDTALNLKDIVFRHAIFNKELSYLWESDNYPTYEQAAEAAIKYCLVKLI